MSKRTNARRTLVLVAILFFTMSCVSRVTKANQHPHYTFVLSDQYVGWIEIIFNDPHSLPVPRIGSGYEIRVPESGICRTSDAHVNDVSAIDEFYYRVMAGSQETRIAIPDGYALPGPSHGGFTFMNTGGRGPGSSWFIFIGPPELRAKVPNADWSKVVADYRATHGGIAKVILDGELPMQGRMSASP
jgi:hypothetical protein